MNTTQNAEYNSQCEPDSEQKTAIGADMYSWTKTKCTDKPHKRPQNPPLDTLSVIELLTKTDLTETEHDCAELTYIYNATQEQIAADLDISQPAVHKALQQANRKIKQLMIADGIAPC